ncbi:hypothetical protein GcM3_169023, partial [Golovinomyces cichoracearum]
GLVVFAKSRLDGKPANLVRQLTLSGREFSSLFDLFEFLYHTYGIKDLYSYYERKFDGITWPSGSDQSQNLALFKAQIAPCKDVLGWSIRAAISKFLSKLPIWTQRELTKLYFNKDDYNEVLCELDNFFCRNYVSRQLLAASKRPQNSNLDDAKSKNSSDSKIGHKNQADNSQVASSKAKEKCSAQFNNQKLGLKEELRELDRREEYAEFPLKIGEHFEMIRCYIVKNCGRHQMILGHRWMQKHDCGIRLGQQKIAFDSTYCTTHCNSHGSKVIVKALEISNPSKIHPKSEALRPGRIIEYSKTPLSVKKCQEL